MSRIGFAAVLSPPDPNCITLSSGTSNRLGQMLGTFEDDKFSSTLESLIDGLNNRIGTLKVERNDLREKLREAEQRAEVLAMQRLYLGFFCGLSAIFVLLLLCK